jgi:membrane protein
VAFSFTLAVFPAIIFLFSLIPYIPIPNVDELIRELIGDMSVLKQVNRTIEDIVNKPRGGLLSFSVITSLYLSSNGMLQLIQTFNRIYRTVERRGYVKTALIALLLTVLLAVAVFSTIVLLIVGQFLMRFLIERGFLSDELVIYALFALRFTAVFILFLLAISFIYYFGPALQNKWRFISIGSVIATLLCMLVSYIFSYYISNFGTYNKIYGSIGAMIALMVWIYMVSVIMLFGFELNASIDQAIARQATGPAEEKR